MSGQTALADVLEREGLGSLTVVMAEQDIDFDIAKELTEADLKELGLSIGERKKFVAAMARAEASPPAPAEDGSGAERRQLTVLFCDLVGSTNLATQLDPEDMRGVISSYLQTCIGVMRKHGGHLAYTQGDGIMTYFGYPQAQEDDAERAVRAGLEAIEAVQNLKTIVRDGLNARIGVATGPVVVGNMANSETEGEDFVIGETPNLAARLQNLAAPGQVILSEVTQTLTGGRFDIESHGSFDLKGFQDEQEVFRALGENDEISRFDQRALTGIQQIIGRSAERTTLKQLWAETQQGEGRLALIEGAPGIGKSRLLNSITARDDVDFIQWQCAPHLANRALHPVAQELSNAAGIMRFDPAEARIAKLTDFVGASDALTDADLPLIADLLGLAQGDQPAMDAVTLAQMTAEVLERRLATRARQAPFLLCVEDAHWADQATLEFLDGVISRLHDLPILLAITFRPEFEPQASWRLRSRSLELSPLGEGAAAALIDKVSGERRLSIVLKRWILEKTDGVPLFIEELTKTILDSVGDAAGTLTVEMLEQKAIPTTLRDSLMSRLDRMGRAKEVAQLGSVIGREFTADMVRAISPRGSGVDASLAMLTEAELLQRGSLNGPDYFVFNHALVQDTAYESILRSSRQEIHEQLAQAMLQGHEAFGAQPPEAIARHCDLGDLAAEAVAHWSNAGQEALKRAANLPAINHLRAALRRLEDLPEGGERDGIELGIQMALMPACMAIYGWGTTDVENAAFRARELSAKLGANEALFGSTWGVWTMYFLRGEIERALETAEAVDMMAGAAGAPMLLTAADHAVGYSQFYRGDLQGALDRFEKGAARFDPAIEAAIIQTFQFSSTLAMRHYGAATLWLLDRADEAAQTADIAASFAHEIDHLPSLAYGYGATGQTLTLQQDWTRLGEVAEQCKRLSSEEGFILWENVADCHLGLAEGFNSNVASGIQTFRAAREKFLSAGALLTDVMNHPGFCQLLILNGEAAEAVSRLDAIIDAAIARWETLSLSELYRVRARARMDLDDRPGAEADLAEALRIAEAQGAVPFIRRAKDLQDELGLTPRT